MSDRSTVRFFEDSFGRDDGADIGGQWAQSGTLQIVDQTLRQSGATATATAYAQIAVATMAADIGSHYEAAIKVACDTDSTTARTATILLRHNGTPGSGDGYGASLVWQQVAAAEVLVLKIRKSVAGVWTDLASATVTSERRLNAASSYDGVFQDLRVKIYDVEGDPVIEASLNERAVPRLTFTDTEYPQFSSGGSSGVFFEDNDAGVNGHIFVSLFAINSIQQEEATVGPAVFLWSFGKIKGQVRTHARRDSSDTLDDSYWSDIVNETLQEFALQHLPAWWWEEKLTIRLKADQDEFVIPPNIMLFDDYLFDTTNNRPKPVIRARDYEQYPASPSNPTSGSVQSFLVVGRGMGGGIAFEPKPAPSSAATFTLRCWRQPAIMTNDDQVPDLPEPLIPGLIWGSVYLYSLRDSDRTHINAAGNQKAAWYRSAARLRNRFHSLAATQVARSGFRVQTAFNRASGLFGR